jgi:hypothetical protein
MASNKMTKQSLVNYIQEQVENLYKLQVLKEQRKEINKDLKILKEVSDSGNHRLRWMVRDSSENISDNELDELERSLPIDEFLDNEMYEYNGNFIITKSEDKINDEVSHMCCGIVSQKVDLSNGEKLYFAFDYGH